MLNKASSRLCSPTTACRTAMMSAIMLLTALAQPGQADSTEPLAEFLDQLHSITSVRMNASVVVHASMGTFSIGGGASYGYLEQDKMFRIGCKTDRNLGTFGDIEYGYDGDTSLVRMMPSGSISKNISVDREAPTALRNPYFYPVTFLFDEGQCLTCRMSIERLIMAREHMTVERLSKNTFVVGSTQFSQKYTVTTKAAKGISVPARISWESPTRGQIEMVLLDYELINGFVWPTAVSTKGLNQEHDARTRSTYFLTTLDFNQLLEPEDFRLNGGGGGEPPYGKSVEPPWNE